MTLFSTRYHLPTVTFYRLHTVLNAKNIALPILNAFSKDVYVSVRKSWYSSPATPKTLTPATTTLLLHFTYYLVAGSIAVISVTATFSYYLHYSSFSYASVVLAAFLANEVHCFCLKQSCVIQLRTCLQVRSTKMCIFVGSFEIYIK